MGVHFSQSYRPQRNASLNSTRESVPLFSQYSLSSLVDRLNSFSFVTGSFVTSSSSTTVSRPLSRKSRRRWRETTLNNPLELAKTAWPVCNTEAIFLPEFKINDSVNESNFEVLRLISKGAFGDVFEVKEKESDDRYAMKILRKSKIVEERCVNQVKDEVRIQSICGHNPFIVSCPFYWQNRRLLFIVTEYVSNGDLHEFCLKRGPLPEELSRIFIAEIASALDFLHNAGVIFRDLKPENVLLDEDYHLKLVDFGLAKWLHYGNKTTTLCGTLCYMAPEIFDGAYGHAVDWWSLGMLSCFLLTLQFAGEGSSREAAGALPGSAAALSLGARDLLGRLLQVDPGRRLRSLLTLATVPFYLGVDLAAFRSSKVDVKPLVARLKAVDTDQTIYIEGFDMEQNNVI